MKGMKNDGRLMEGTKDGNEQENKSEKETEIFEVCVKRTTVSQIQRGRKKELVMGGII